MSMKNLAREVESIALALSEEGGYEYYHIDDELRELEKDVSDAQAENAKLRELCATVIDDWMSKVCPTFPFCECGGEYQDCTDETCGNQIYRQMARELGVDE